MYYAPVHRSNKYYFVFPLGLQKPLIKNHKPKTKNHTKEIPV